MPTLTKKYLFSIAVSTSWFPGSKIEQFEVILPSKFVINTGVIEYYAKEKGYKNFKVIGFIPVGKIILPESDNTK